MSLFGYVTVICLKFGGISLSEATTHFYYCVSAEYNYPVLISETEETEMQSHN